MGVFETIGTETHESVHFGEDKASGLRAIVAIHSTTLGPSLGGTRFYPYADEHTALVDVLRLSKGMTYKAAAAPLIEWKSTIPSLLPPDTVLIITIGSLS